VPSLKLPVAVNCCVLPGPIDGFGGVTAIDTSDTVGGGVVVPEEELPPHPTNKLTASSRTASSTFFIVVSPGARTPTIR
jgi:hypothetical protein